jgi:hypothetical protein
MLASTDGSSKDMAHLDMRVSRSIGLAMRFVSCGRGAGYPWPSITRTT